MNLKDYKEEYKKIEKVFCPFLNSEVFFTSRGYNHLIWKSQFGKRSEKDVLLRMDSLKLVPEILARSGTLQEYEKTNTQDYFAFIAILGNKKYKVVVAKVLDKKLGGKYNFVSVIPGWKTGVRDKKLQTKNPLQEVG